MLDTLVSKLEQSDPIEQELLECRVAGLVKPPLFIESKWYWVTGFVSQKI